MFYKEKELIDFANQNDLKVADIWVWGPTDELPFCLLFDKKGSLKFIGYYSDIEWGYFLSKSSSPGVAKYVKSVFSWFNDGKGFNNQPNVIREIRDECKFYKANLSTLRSSLLN